MQTERRKLNGIESPRPRTARDELGRTRLGEVDGVVVVNKFGGVSRASAVWDQGPRGGKSLGTVLELVGQNSFTAG